MGVGGEATGRRIRNSVAANAANASVTRATVNIACGFLPPSILRPLEAYSKQKENVWAFMLPEAGIDFKTSMSLVFFDMATHGHDHGHARNADLSYVFQHGHARGHTWPRMATQESMIFQMFFNKTTHGHGHGHAGRRDAGRRAENRIFSRNALASRGTMPDSQSDSHSATPGHGHGYGHTGGRRGTQGEARDFFHGTR